MTGAPGGNISIAGTQRATWPGASPTQDALEGVIWLTAWLRPRPGCELDAAKAQALGAMPPGERTYVDRAALIGETNADPADVELLRRYCDAQDIEIVAEHWRSVVLRASVEKHIAAFGATAGIYELADKRRFRHRSGALHAPPELAPVLRGPFGIHQWPRSHAVGPLHSKATPLSASEVAARYKLPDADGSGECVGVLQMRGAFEEADFVKCMQAQTVAAKVPIVKRVDNAELTHVIETAKDLESAIDTQVIGALAPGAQIVVYATPDDERGVLDGIRAAIFDDEHRPSVLSISFGYAEQLWTPAALQVLDDLFIAAALLGITILCASGDHGSETDAAGVPHVLAPASSPFAHACGGTVLSRDGNAVESGWPNSGGGFSAVYPSPPWQRRSATGRGVPDVAAQVDPGYTVFIEGAPLALGGTSAAAPMWAALTARLNQRVGKPAGFFTPLLYGTTQLLTPISTGGNDRYPCEPGWNASTGLGVPNGEALERALRGGDQ